MLKWSNSVSVTHKKHKNVFFYLTINKMLTYEENAKML